jgi:hypothetical protein
LTRELCESDASRCCGRGYDNENNKIFCAMLRPAYLSQRLDRPLPTKDGGTLRTVLDARTYMLALSKNRERRAQWQRAAELLLGEADVATLSKQVELALF